MKFERQYSGIDQICLGFDQVLRSLVNQPKTTGRLSPAHQIPEAALSADERQGAAALMRVNHSGEICAQALYQGQALASRGSDTAAALRQAAIEEGDHLAWCSERIKALGSHTSYLNPFWYFSSLSMGFIAGLLGDRLSLGFVAETEKQVVAHLDRQLALLPAQDQKSSAILKQMQLDEEEHRKAALSQGGGPLPMLIRRAMKGMSSVMVKVAYWI